MITIDLVDRSWSYDSMFSLSFQFFFSIEIIVLLSKDVGIIAQMGCADFPRKLLLINSF